MTRALTPKQEAFCLVYFETGNASEAYRRAYNVKTTNEATINRSAKSIADNPKIIARVRELQKPALEKAMMTVESHLAELKSLRDKAAQVEQFSAAIKAEMARGTVSGFYVQKHELYGKDGQPLIPPSINIGFQHGGPGGESGVVVTDDADDGDSGAEG